jgi:hypothetical protein
MILGCAPVMPQVGNQPCQNLNGSDLVVNEFMADPVGQDTGKQYIEIYNAAGRDVDLGGLTVFHSFIDGSRMRAMTLETQKIPAGGYFVAGDTGDDVNARPAYINYGYGTRLGALRHENGVIGLRCGARVIDQVSYANSEPGHARELDGALFPASVVTRSDVAWCNATKPLNELQPGQNFGTPGQPNGPCSQSDAGITDVLDSGNTAASDAGVALGQCLDDETGALRDAVNPTAGDLVITEVQAAPTVGNNGPGEWFEVHSNSNVDINGIELSNDGSGTTTLLGDKCLNIKAGSWLLFARSSDPLQNGGLPPVTAVFDFALADSVSSTHPERAVKLRFGAVVLDQVTWTKTATGASFQRSSASLDATPRQASGDWCTTPATNTYGVGDRGSPALPNTNCTSDQPDAAAPNGCRDSTGQLRSPIAPAAGDFIVTEVMAAPTVGNNGAGEWFEARALARFDLNGVELANESSGSETLSSDTCMSVQAGDWILFARNSDPTQNGGLPPAAATFGFTLADSSSSTHPERSVIIRFNGSELSRASWTSSTRGKSWQRSANAFDNDAGIDSFAWCLAPSAATFGAGDWGTPGSMNFNCP